MNTITQNHNGSGDNVRDKIYIEIKSLAPADLIDPMEMVFESLRKKDHTTAKIQMGVLKTMAKKDPEAAALVEAICIYGEIVEDEDQSLAWGVVSRIAVSTKNDIVKDVCIAALLRLSQKTDREEAAKCHYLNVLNPGLYAREAFLRIYADEAQLETTSEKLILSEGELTGVVEGALRLNLIRLALRTANRLLDEFPSYNATVLQVLATAFNLNGDVSRRHLWLNTPEVKERLDILTAQVVDLLELSAGTDTRLYDMACPIFECYQGLAPNTLFEVLKRYLQFLEPNHPKLAAKFKAIEGNDNELPQMQQDFKAALDSPHKRTYWCRKFLSASNHKLDEVMAFIRLATPSELERWLLKETQIEDASAMEAAFVRLLCYSFQHTQEDNHLLKSQQLSKQVDNFLREWSNEIPNISAERIFELAEALFIAKLPHKALDFTSVLIPDQELWASPFIHTHLKCLLESQQYKTFENVIAKVSGAESSLSLMCLQSLKAEQLGEIETAIEIIDRLIGQFPEEPYCWFRGSFLRDRYLDKTEQLAFQQRIPDSILRDHSPDVVAILYFLTKSGNFKRAEERWVEWFIENPRARAVELVNFHFGLTTGSNGPVDFDVTYKMERCAAAFQYEQNGRTMTKLIVDDQQEMSECTLQSSSQLAKLLQSLSIGENGNLGMVSYKVTEKLPPYVACIRIALQLRHNHNDGSDCFAMLELPSDTEQLVPYLEEKLGQGIRNKKKLNNVDNIPLYIRGHALYPDNAFKAAINCWTDVNIPKSLLFNKGEATPNELVLDAYGIGYLAVTNLAQKLLDTGTTLVIPHATYEDLKIWVKEISDESFMLIGVNDIGKLFRTTASDLEVRDGHILRSLNLILNHASIIHPSLHDTAFEIYSIKDGIDSSVYEAMQLSLANNIPWFCMDGAFASLHQSNLYPTANVQAIVERCMASSSFDFDHKRHGLLLYAVGALPLPLTYSEMNQIASNPNSLAGFILYKIIYNHGRQIFMGKARSLYLLDVILNHLISQFHSERANLVIWPSYTPWTTYDTHVFNHGISLFLKNNEGGSAEYRMAKAIMYMGTRFNFYRQFIKCLVGFFMRFAQGHFMDIEAIKKNLSSFEDHL